MNLSIQIATRNRASRLDKTLNALGNCKIPAGLCWELIVVDNGSTDSTAEVLKKHSRSLPIQKIDEPLPGLARARNAGLKVCSGDLIVFTDDDVAPETDWVNSYWEGFKNHAQGYYFGGPIRCQYEEFEPTPQLLKLPGIPHSVKGLDWGPQDGDLGNIWFIGINWACPRQALLQTGFFNETLGPVADKTDYPAGEETELMQRLRAAGLRPFYLHEAEITHCLPTSEADLTSIGDRLEAQAFGGFVRRNHLEDIPPAPLFFKKLKLGFEAQVARHLASRPSPSEKMRRYLDYRKKRGRYRAVSALYSKSSAQKSHSEKPL